MPAAPQNRICPNQTMNPYTQIIRNATTGHATKASDRNFAHSAPPPLLLCFDLLFTGYNDHG